MNTRPGPSSAPFVAGPEVLLLGPVDLRRGEGSAPIGGAKVRAVLAQLALAVGHVVPTEQLIDGVWGEDPPTTAANTLQYHVGVLRKALTAVGAPEAVSTRPPGYRLDLATDVAGFHAHRRSGEEAVAQGLLPEASEAYVRALALWRGPALADLLGFPFAAARAVTLEEQRLACVEAWLEAELGRGRGEELVPELEAMVAAHPTRERFWQQLMVAQYRGGRQGDALEAFNRARRLLDEELGVEPSPQLRAVQSAVLAQDPALLGPGRARPAAVGSLTAAPTRLRSSLPVSSGWLVRSDGDRVALGPGTAVLGRQSGCDVLVVDDEVSRRHARIVSTGDGHAVEDLGSTNGTYVNGNRVAVLTRLAHGDRIELGDTVLRYEAAN